MARVLDAVFCPAAADSTSKQRVEKGYPLAQQYGVGSKQYQYSKAACETPATNCATAAQRSICGLNGTLNQRKRVGFYGTLQDVLLECLGQLAMNLAEPD